MTEHHGADDLQVKVWQVFEKAIDNALSTEDSTALDVGMRAARTLVDHGVVAPFERRRPGRAGSARVVPDYDELRVQPLVFEVAADVDPLQLADELDAARIDIARRFGIVVDEVAVRADASTTGWRLVLRGATVEHGLDVPLRADVMVAAIARHLDALLMREDVARIVEAARTDSPIAVNELIPNLLSLGDLKQVLQRLVAEQVPILDMPTILNALADNAVYTKDPSALTEHVRAQLTHRFTAPHRGEGDTLRAVLLSLDAERAIQNAIHLNETGQVLMLDPNASRALQDQLLQVVNEHDLDPPVLVTPPKIRRHVRALLERNFPDVVVLSFAELGPGDRLEAIATIDVASFDVPAHAVPPVMGSGNVPGGDWLMGG